MHLHPPQDIAPATMARPRAIFTGLSTLGTPAAGAGQDNLSSPGPGQGTSGVHSQLFNNSGQLTIGQSPRPGTGVPISAGRFNSNDVYLKYDLQVIPGKLDALHKKYSAPLIAMDHLHPMTDIKRTLSDYLYAFKASGNQNRPT